VPKIPDATDNHIAGHAERLTINWAKDVRKVFNIWPVLDDTLLSFYSINYSNAHNASAVKLSSSLWDSKHEECQNKAFRREYKDNGLSIRCDLSDFYLYKKFKKTYFDDVLCNWVDGRPGLYLPLHDFGYCTACHNLAIVKGNCGLSETEYFTYEYYKRELEGKPSSVLGWSGWLPSGCFMPHRCDTKISGADREIEYFSAELENEKAKNSNIVSRLNSSIRLMQTQVEKLVVENVKLKSSLAILSETQEPRKTIKVSKRNYDTSQKKAITYEPKTFYPARLLCPSMLPDAIAAYVILEPTETAGSYRYKYVGFSATLRRRFGEHRKLKALKGQRETLAEDDLFGWITLPSTYQALYAECFLTGVCAPYMNFNAPKEESRLLKIQPDPIFKVGRKAWLNSAQGLGTGHITLATPEIAEITFPDTCRFLSQVEYVDLTKRNSKILVELPQK